MAADILVTFVSAERKPLVLPVGSEASFLRYWMTTAAKLNLRWFPRDDDDRVCPIPGEALPSVLEELKAMGAHWEKEAHAETRDYLLRCVEPLIETLSTLDPADVKEIDIC
jgi:hypothetical protein